MKFTGQYSAITRLILAGVIIAAASCSDKPSDNNALPYLAKLGSATLTAEDVHRAMPGGLSPEDSVKFVRAFVGTWIDSHLITDVAADKIDMTDIDRLTEEYRRSLIMLEYRRLMFESHAKEIPDDSIQVYYDSHKSDFVLERPLVRGVYIKIANDAKNLRTIKRLYQSKKHNDIDQLEKEVIGSAVNYDYFRDKWIDWEQIETRIPFDFGTNPNNWPSAHKNLETSSNGFTYLLLITDVLPVGSSMPLDAARHEITERLLNRNRRAYDAQLQRELYQEALDKGRLKISPDVAPE